MKKIYMILAAITLLSLSLNAQTTYEKVTSASQIEAGKKYIFVSEDANTAMTTTASNNRLGGESVTISNNTVTLGNNSNVAVFTLGGSSNSWTLVNGGKYLSGARNNTNLTLATTEGTYSTWRLNNNNGSLSGYRAVNSAQTSRAVLYRASATLFGDYATSNLDSGTDYSNAFLYVEVSTNPVITASPNSVSMNSIPGTSVTETVSVTGLNLTDDITATISGADASLFGVNPTSLGTSGGSLTVTYTPSATGTHTATLTLSSTGAPDVTITLNGTCTQDVTVCDGSETSSYLPVYGSWYDSETGQKNQMIYNASLLTSLVGKSITSMTFYAPYGISFSGGSVTYSLGTTSTNAFSSATALTDNVTAVATVVPNGETEWTITFSSPYPYNGGNLLIQVDTQTGSYSSTSFTGMDMSSNVGYYSYTGYSGVSNNLTQILPKVTFTYEDNNTPELTAPTNNSTVNVGENNGAGVDKTVTVSGRNLTENLTVSVTGTGFSVSPTTLTAADVNAGTTVTVTYNGTDPTATGTLTISSNEASVTVNLTATYVDITPVLTAPTTGSTVNVGTNEGGGVSTNVTVSGNYLTEALTVSVTGTGFSVSPSSISAADANAGATVTVTYNGTDPNATGTLTIGSNEVSVTVNLTASYVYHAPELTAPTNNSTVNVGTNTGSGVSKTINIKGNYLTQDLNVTVSGTGFSVSRDVTVTAAEANAGKDIIVTYNGTNENATGTLTISSSEVSATVNLTASYADNGEITVANGTDTDYYLPVYGSYYEEVQMNQMIYPASMLTDMEGKYITSITFYPASGQTSGGDPVSGIMFSGGKVMLSLGSTTNNSFTSNSAISATVTEVASITDVQQDANLTAWTFTFDTPYLYEGGNLLLQVDTEVGNYYRTFFYGTTMSNMGRHQCSGDGGNALHNFLPKATFTYSSTAPLPPAVEGGLLRLHLLFCDQLKANIPDDNSHPDAYGYVLRWEPENEEMKESGRVKVNIQKTDCEVLSYYTLDQIDLDKHIGSYDAQTNTIKHDEGLTMDVITAQVEFDLSSSNDMLNYYYLQGKEAGYPSPDEFLSQLHRQENFTYREMWPDAPEFDEVYDSGVHHYFDDSTPIKTGHYGNANEFVSYAPSVTTWGIQRRYFELDGKDNTYGAPVWKTAVGKVEMGSATPVAELQTGASGSTNWEYNGEACSLYILDNIEAIGYLPPTNLTKVKFEPYMFRVFVESKNGLLRGYKFVEGNGETTGDHYEGIAADPYGPICVWSGYVQFDENGNPTDDLENGVHITYQNAYGPYTFNKNKVDRSVVGGAWDKDENNAIFAASDELVISGYNENGEPIYNDITTDDLNVFVRFYYNVEGRADGHVIMGRAADADRPGNGAESPGKAPSPWTAVKEISYNGEVVSVTYVNTLGMQSDQPFDGVNIVVTRYDDGKVRTTKVVR